MNKEKITVEVVKGVEGVSVYFNGHRVCGSKPWGGGKVILSQLVDKSNFEQAIGMKKLDFVGKILNVEKARLKKKII